MKIHVTDTDGEQNSIEVVGGKPDPERVLEMHGYDPAAVSYEVDDPDGDLRDAIQNASNLRELKFALTDSDHPAQARGRGR